MLTEYFVFGESVIDDSNMKKTVSTVSNVTKSCYQDKNITDEQKFFMLSIRQAVLKIASNPVGKRLFCRILNKIENKKILILQTRCDAKDGSFSFCRGLSDKLQGMYVCVTVPWELGKSTQQMPAAGAVRTKIDKQLAVCVVNSVADEMEIIGQSNPEKTGAFDEKPFYISLCHEFIHCLHYLESRIVDLSEEETNRIMFLRVCKKCFWDKNVELLFQDIDFCCLFGDGEDNKFAWEQYGGMYKYIESLVNCEGSPYAIKESDCCKTVKSNIIVDNLVSWSAFGDAIRVSKVLYSELYDNLVNAKIYARVLIHLILTIMTYKEDKWFEWKKEQYGPSWDIKGYESIRFRYELIRSVLKNVVSKYCSNKLISNCYFKDYNNGEELYTVTGLYYNKDSKKFIIDNVSELSFNALESNNIIRISYSSDCLLSNTNDNLIKNVRGKLLELIRNGKARVLMKQLLKLLTGNEPFDKLDTCWKLEDTLCERLGISDDLECF